MRGVCHRAADNGLREMGRRRRTPDNGAREPIRSKIGDVEVAVQSGVDHQQSAFAPCTPCRFAVSLTQRVTKYILII